MEPSEFKRHFGHIWLAEIQQRQYRVQNFFQPGRLSTGAKF